MVLEEGAEAGMNECFALSGPTSTQTSHVLATCERNPNSTEQ